MYQPCQKKIMKTTEDSEVTEIQNAEENALVCQAFTRFIFKHLYLNITKAYSWHNSQEIWRSQNYLSETPAVKIDLFWYYIYILVNKCASKNNMENRLGAAHNTSRGLLREICKKRKMKPLTMLDVYQAIVFPTVLYSCETWALWTNDIKWHYTKRSSSLWLQMKKKTMWLHLATIVKYLLRPGWQRCNTEKHSVATWNF